MRILTDNRDRARPLFGRALDWQSVAKEHLPEGTLLWEILGGADLVDVASGPPVGAWSRLYVVHEAPRSQFDALLEALGSGVLLDGPVALLALTGHRFHGQRGRPWQVEEGNLFLTLGLPLAGSAVELTPRLLMLPTVAVVEAIRELSGGRLHPEIKWVNDILIDGRKVGGVLAASQCRGPHIVSAVVGIGVNLVGSPEVEPTPFVPAVTSLAGAACEIPLGDFLRVLLEILDRWLPALNDGDSAAQLLEAYRAASCILGREVRVYGEDCDLGAGVSWQDPEIAGRVEAIGADLTLRLEGQAQPVTRGRLAFEDACRKFGGR